LVGGESIAASQRILEPEKVKRENEMKNNIATDRASPSAVQTAPIPLRVLILEDNPADVELSIQELNRAGFEIHSDAVDTEAAFSARLQSGVYDLILSDFRIPSWSGIDAFRFLKRSRKDIPFILVTGTLGEEAAVDLIKEGVADYILKDRLARLPLAVSRALQEKSTRVERERAVGALRVSEARVRCLVESNIIGIAIGDLEGKLIDANEAVLKLLGYSREDIQSGRLRWDSMTPPEFYETDKTAVEQLRKTGVASPWEKQFFRKDGNRVDVLIGVTTLVAEGGRIECVTFILDIGERKQLEQQLRQSQKMEAIGQLAGGVAHDFNNLLSVIIGYSEIVLDNKNLDTKTRTQCEEIKKAGDRAALLTRQLLAFSRQQVLAPKVLNLNNVVIEIEKMLRRLIGEDVELRTNLDRALGSVKADRGQIEQVIMNLVVNSRDAMPDGGKLTIETSNADVDNTDIYHRLPFRPGPYVLLTVTDTGVGMDEDTKSRIFEPFFTTKGIGKGTGLGLSTVYGVVNQSGGHICVYSELGRWTVFKIYLPRVDEAAKPSRPIEPKPEVLPATETVLLVEDEELVRTLTCSILEEAGYSVIEASNGALAIEIAQRHVGTIHLLLTDVVMPGMNGRVLAQKMAAVRPKMKVLYVSGYTGGSSVQGDLLDVGANLLPKPFSRSTLLRKLRETLDVQ
jgi:two-component system, cell cycle sensor histidine kinase and response regulator CckA